MSVHRKASGLKGNQFTSRASAWPCLGSRCPRRYAHRLPREGRKMSIQIFDRYRHLAYKVQPIFPVYKGRKLSRDYLPFEEDAGRDSNLRNALGLKESRPDSFEKTIDGGHKNDHPGESRVAGGRNAPSQNKGAEYDCDESRQSPAKLSTTPRLHADGGGQSACGQTSGDDCNRSTGFESRRRHFFENTPYSTGRFPGGHISGMAVLRELRTANEGADARPPSRQPNSVNQWKAAGSGRPCNLPDEFVESTAKPVSPRRPITKGDNHE